ncbi:glycosyltransferase family 2 protein [Faecalibacterium intestinale]|uniref:Glycosyltransferase family 2 protein n=1 Tax=Faecalibacterium intestinale TaxID=3133155 RepID=A0ABV1C1S8_9FIRM
MEKPLISVIVPAYNVEKFIGKCIDNILRQSFKDFEVLLIDDGAKDSTPEICDACAKKDSRIKVYHKENGGLSDARNYGIDRMQGKYVTFIDSDDYVDSGYFEYLYGLITQEEDIQIAICGKKSVREDENASPDPETFHEIITGERAVQKMLCGHGSGHSAWGKLYSADLWKTVRYPKGKIYEDYATTYRVMALVDKAAWGNAAMYFYVQHIESIMHQKCSRRSLSLVDIADEETEFIVKKWPALKQEALARKVTSELKCLQNILNAKNEEFDDYKQKIVEDVRRHKGELLASKKVALKTKIKIIALLLGERTFGFIYNLNDGDKKYL